MLNKARVNSRQSYKLNTMQTPRNRIYKTVYNPDISQTCKTFICNNIDAVYENDVCLFYSISLVIETLEEMTADSNEDCYMGICDSDIKELKDLFLKEEVAFIELC